jgi:hypothetical protein
MCLQARLHQPRNHPPAVKDRHRAAGFRPVRPTLSAQVEDLGKRIHGLISVLKGPFGRDAAIDERSLQDRRGFGRPSPGRWPGLTEWALQARNARSPIKTEGALPGVRLPGPGRKEYSTISKILDAANLATTIQRFAELTGEIDS